MPVMDGDHASLAYRVGSSRALEKRPEGCYFLDAMQELRKGGGFDYAGCLSVPRLITLRGMLKVLLGLFH